MVAFNVSYTALPGVAILLLAIVVLAGGVFASGLFETLTAGARGGGNPGGGLHLPAGITGAFSGATARGGAPAGPQQPLPPPGVAAADPTTSAVHLDEIARYFPDLRVAVAGNPSTGPDTVGYLAGLGDPEVTAALQRRG